MNEAMGTVVGGLIQMNAQLVMSKTALVMLLTGVLCGGVMLAGAIIWWLNGNKRWWMLLIGALILAGIAYCGNNMPREKIIHACASGPISLESIGARYDIVDVNGKELTLRVR